MSSENIGMGLFFSFFFYLFELSRPPCHIGEMEWPRQRKATLSWQHLSAREADTGARWTVIWDTKRNAESDGRNTAVEKVESAALDRARHLLRMGFVVYEIRDPSGSIFLNEIELRARCGLQPTLHANGEGSLSVSEEANRVGVERDDLARAMIEVHGDRAAGVARGNARVAATARQMAEAKNWLHVVEIIQQRRTKLL